jgi:hypothetical protein
MLILQVFCNVSRIPITLQMEPSLTGSNWSIDSTKPVILAAHHVCVPRGLGRSCGKIHRPFSLFTYFTESVDAITRSIAVKSFPYAGGWYWQKKQHFELQSSDFAEAEAIEVSEQIGASEMTEQNVSFTDNEGGVFFDSPSSGNTVAMVDNTDDISLGDFLSRPTLINSATWTTGDLIGVKQNVLPWTGYLNNPIIKKKLDNYTFLRAQLHVKVVLNGTPFQSGAMRVCYQPMLGTIESKIRTNPVSDIPLIIPFSQTPGFYLYPQANSGGEMVLPFFYHKNWLDITVKADVDNFGTLSYVTFAPLRVAVTGGSTTVSIQTYAWLTDVHLMGSTINLALQADEYGTGPISRPASAIASLAGSLSKVPIIGKFARATEIGAGATSKIASLFGFTNVPVIENVSAFTPQNAPMLASSQIGTPVQKLTLDPKQELSIDPSPHGIGSADELSISYIKSKESYFGGTSWATTDAVGTQLWNTRVNPFQTTATELVDGTDTTVGQRVYHVPVSYLASLFRHWRGDLIIRVKIVCTKFHKGRLKISYDPRGDITTSDPPENAVYTQIVDIGENDDLEIRIPYHQALAWLQVDTTLVPDNSTQGNPNAPRLNIDNGVLTVRVLTTLTAPAAGTINIMFFIRGADNLEFANPVERIGGLTGTYPTPSFFALQAEDKTNVVSKSVVLGKPTVTDPQRYGLNFGESFHSLRDYIHRYSTTDSVTPVATAGVTYSSLIKNYQRMPTTPGYVTYPTSAAKVVTIGTSNYAFLNMHPLPYIAGLFLGYRGGVNYTITPGAHSNGTIPYDNFRVFRKTGSSGFTTNAQIMEAIPLFGGVVTSSVRQFAINNSIYPRNGCSGQAITAQRTNATLNWMIPDYNNYNFSFVSPTTYALGSSVDGTNIQGALVQIQASTTDSTNTIFVSTAAAAPDFTCLFFLCCPTLDYAIANPTPI